MARYLPKQVAAHTYDNNVLVASEIGLTVKVYSESVQVMSDIFEYQTFAVCYNPATDSFESRYVNSDYGSTTAYAEVDAEPELMVRYAAWIVEQAAENAGFHHSRELDEARNELRHVKYGRNVKVVRGRKVPVGTTGRVFWTGDSKYGTRVGIELASGERVFTATHNVEVEVDPAEVAKVEAMFAKSAVRQAAKFAAERAAAVAAAEAKYAAALAA